MLAAVQRAADAAGRLFPLSLAAEGSRQIGGNLSTNAGGVNVLRYGNAREQVLGLEVVLPDGRVWDGLRGLRKDNTGYDLKQLFLGAEGTLGMITAAVLRLYPKPTASATAWIALATPRAAVELLATLCGAIGERISAFELVSRDCLEAVLAHVPGHARPARRAASLVRAGRVRPTAAAARVCSSGWKARSANTRPSSPRAASRRARCGASGRPFPKRSSATSSTTSRCRSQRIPEFIAHCDAALRPRSRARKSSASATSATATCTTTSARRRCCRSATR